MTISSWRNYIEPGRNGTVAAFEAGTDVSVNYREEITNDGRILEKLQPLLEQGESGGRDILVVSDWMAKEMYDRGYLQEIDHDDLPTVFRNMEPSLRSPASDPERRFSIPWQGSMTGLWLDARKAPYDSVNEFFGPDIAGKVAMPPAIRDSVALTLRSEEKDPATASTADWLETINRIEIATDVGQVRNSIDTEYIKGLNSGEFIMAIGRSTDAPLIRNPNVEWLAPRQGCVLSARSMVIPVGAPNPAAALAWMNHAYQPEVAAGITEYVRHVSPVRGLKARLESQGSKLARDPLIFPSKEVTSNCADQVSPPSERVNRVWQEALED